MHGAALKTCTESVLTQGMCAGLHRCVFCVTRRIRPPGKPMKPQYSRAATKTSTPINADLNGLPLMPGDPAGHQAGDTAGSTVKIRVGCWFLVDAGCVASTSVRCSRRDVSR